MKVLITGSAGFIGYHLTKKLLDKNIRVIGVDNINNYYDPRVKIKRNLLLKKYSIYKFYKLDITKFKNLEKIYKKYKFQTVIHLAAQAGVRYSITNPFAYIKSNIDGFYNILHLSKKYKIKHLIYASSSSVYGDQKKQPIATNANTNNPQSLYAATKKSNEILVESYNRMYRLNATGLRFFTNYGNFGRPDMSIYKFTKNILKNKKIELFNYGNHKRDFTHISDTVEIIYRIIKNRLKTSDHKILNIASGRKVDLKYVIKLIERFTNHKAKVKNLDLQKGDVKETHANIKETINLTKYKPRKTIESGIEDFINWYRKFTKDI